MAADTPGLSNVRWVAEQYKTPQNLNARIQLHKRFATNPYPWPQWVFDHLRLAPGMRVLEIGGGPGGLWDENRQRIPATTRVFFTDQSTGMVTQAISTLRGLAQFAFGVADAQWLPFMTGSFDVVVANHMLYHVPNRSMALGEIRRVLKSTGVFFAATNDRTHMHEVRDLAKEYQPGTSLRGQMEQLASNNERFPFDVATQELSEHFGQIQLHRYANNLLVTDADALADYMLSGMSIHMPAEAQAPFRAWLRSRIAAQGPITVTTAAGLFEATSAP